MDHRLWLRHFERNKDRPDSHVPTRIDVPMALRRPLVASLRTFHAGETGEGRVVAQARALLNARAPAFVEALRLYIAEEGRHARELALMLRALGAEPAPAPPTASAFRVARHAIGFHTKMAILAAAEVVGIVYYDLLAERVPNAPFRRAVQVIAAEERAHVVFQREFFAHDVADGIHRDRRTAASLGIGVAMGAAVAAATAVFALDQRELLAVLGVSPGELLRRTASVSREALTTHALVAMAGVTAEHESNHRQGRGAPRSRSLAPFAAFMPPS